MPEESTPRRGRWTVRILVILAVLVALAGTTPFVLRAVLFTRLRSYMETLRGPHAQEVTSAVRKVKLLFATQPKRSLVRYLVKQAGKDDFITRETALTLLVEMAMREAHPERWASRFEDLVSVPPMEPDEISKLSPANNIVLRKLRSHREMLERSVKSGGMVESRNAKWLLNGLDAMEKQAAPADGGETTDTGGGG